MSNIARPFVCCHPPPDATHVRPWTCAGHHLLFLTSPWTCRSVGTRTACSQGSKTHRRSQGGFFPPLILKTTCIHSTSHTPIAPKPHIYSSCPVLPRTQSLGGALPLSTLSCHHICFPSMPESRSQAVAPPTKYPPFTLSQSHTTASSANLHPVPAGHNQCRCPPSTIL